METTLNGADPTEDMLGSGKAIGVVAVGGLARSAIAVVSSFVDPVIWWPFRGLPSRPLGVDESAGVIPEPTHPPRLDTESLRLTRRWG